MTPDQSPFPSIAPWPYRGAVPPACGGADRRRLGEAPAGAADSEAGCEERPPAMPLTSWPRIFPGL